MINRCRPYIDYEILHKAVFFNEDLESDPVKQFEDEFASYIGTKKAIAIDSGRAALVYCLKTIGISRGDEIIVQSLICHVVIDAILEMKATPIFFDNDLSNYNILEAVA